MPWDAEMDFLLVGQTESGYGDDQGKGVGVAGGYGGSGGGGGTQRQSYDDGNSVFLFINRF